MRKLSIFIFCFISTSIAFSQNFLQEGFEIWPLEDWQIVLLGEATDGWRDDFEGISHTGIHSAYSSISNQHSDNWLVSPAIHVINDNYEFRFWELSSDIDYYEKATVLISTGSADPEDDEFMVVAECLQNTDSFMEQTIDLSSYQDQTIYVAFRYEGTWHHWYLDDVIIAPADFNDAGLTNVVSPEGVSELALVEEVIVNVQNFGGDAIEDLSIEWKVNGDIQTIAEFSSLNLMPGQNIDLTLGDYNFAAEGTYGIEASLILENDFDESNNLISSTYEIAPFKDIELSYLLQEGMVPSPGDLEIQAFLKNNSESVVNIAEISWSVNGINQDTYQSSTLDLKSGESTTINLGTFDFDKGLHEIAANLSALGDISDDDNFYMSTLAVDTFYESFEGRIFPPEGWSIDFGTRDGINFGDPVEGAFYYVSSVDDNYFGVVSDTMFTPILEIKEGDHFRFYIKSNAFLSASHSLIFKNTETGEINLIQGIPNSQGLNTWELRDIDISSVAGIGQIGIASNATGSYGESKFDLFTSDASLYLAAKDLKILNGDMYFLALQNNPTEFTAELRNAGSSFVSGNDYQLKLMESAGNELASVNGVDLNPWEEHSINISHIFEALGEQELYFKIEYLEDEIQSNNTFRSNGVSVVPNTVLIDKIGSPEFRNLNIPFTPNGNTNSLGEDDLSQLLYYNDEFNQAGEIYGIAYYYDNLLESDNVTKYPLQVWIAQSSSENMENGWISNDNMILVFDDTLTILPGHSRDLYIPFDEPVLINGIDNIVIKNHQYDPSWPPSIFRMYSSSSNSELIRSISVSDVYQLDVENPPSGFYQSTDICYTRFIIDPSVDLAILSGTTYDAFDNSQLQNAEISIAGSSLLEVTGEDGDFEFPEIVKGTYTLKASAQGFITQEQELELIDDNQTIDFYLTRKAEISISGRIVGNNDLTTGLENVLIKLKNEDNITEVMSSDAEGEFSYPTVYGQTSYEIDFYLYGYLVKTLLVDADDTEIALGDIVLEQEFISPFDVEADDTNSPLITWKSPKQSEKIQLQNDLNNISASYTNEPNEEVWLGNYFPISEITTITSVEIQTDIYENAIDLVTIDVFDYATNELLASSKPFLIYADSLHKINIPNIVVYNDIAVMLRWENNPESTNALALDFSEEDIFNGAIIRYQSQGIALLSEFFGGNAPNMSFLVRTNTLDPANPTTNNEIPEYNIFRGLASEFPNVNNWKQLNDIALTNLKYLDVDTTGIQGEDLYRYGVERIYTNGFSQLTFSNIIQGSIISSTNNPHALLDLVVFPNPTSSYITIDLGDDKIESGLLKIIDIAGKLVRSYKIESQQTGKITLNISDIAAGTYHVYVESNKRYMQQEFIKL